MNNNLVRTGLYYLALAGLFVVPFLAFYVSNSLFFPYITGKNFAFRIIVEIVTAIWLVLLATGKEYWPKRSKILYALVAFVVVMGVATYFSDNSYKSFWSNFERMEGYVTHLHLLFYFLCLTSLLKTEKLWKWFLTTNIGASLLIGFYGLLQLAGKAPIMQGGVRVDSTLGNAGYVGTYMFFLFFLTVYLWLQAKAKDSHLKLLSGLTILATIYLAVETFLVAKTFDWSLGVLILTVIVYLTTSISAFLTKQEIWRKALLFAPALVLQFVILWATATRGALLGFIGALLIIGIVLAIRGGQTYRKWALGSIGLILVLAGIFWLAKDTQLVRGNPTLERFAAISLADQTTKSRFLVWNMAWQGFKERPILGWGQENFSVVFNKYYSPEMYAQEPWFDRSHNVFLDWLIAGGLLGLLTYLSIFGALVYTVMILPKERMPIEAKAVFLGLIGGYFFQNLFIFDNLTSYLLFFGVLGYISHRAADSSLEISDQETKIETPNKSLSSDVTVTALIAVVIAIPTGFLINYINIQPILAGQSLIRALDVSRQIPSANSSNGAADQVALAVNDRFKQIIAKNTFANGEVREQYLTFAAGAAGQANVSPKAKQEVVVGALSEFANQFSWNPNDARGYMLFGHYLTAFGQFPQAAAALDAALKLSPNKQTIMFEQSVLQLISNQPTLAVATAKRAFDLQPKFDEARSVYAYALYATGQKAAADKLLIDRYQTKAVNDPRLINIFIQQKDYSTLIAIFEQLIKDQPDNLQAYLNLALVYSSTNNIGRVNAVLEAALNRRKEWQPIVNDFNNRLKSGEVKL